MIRNPARIRFLTRNHRELQGLRKVNFGLCALAAGFLMEPQHFLGTHLPRAAAWLASESTRMLVAGCLTVAGVAVHRHVKRFYARRYGQVVQSQPDPWPTGALDWGWLGAAAAFWVGAWTGWRWLLGLSALVVMILVPLKWRQDGGIVPSELLAAVLLPGLTLALPWYEPAVKLHDASSGTFAVAFGAAVAAGGILDHLLLVRSFPQEGQTTDD